MTIGTRLFTWWKGEEVGRDADGNRYYRGKSTPKGRRQRRWVIYDGAVEASRVPPEWHAWLHHTTDEVPPEGGKPKRAWQKPHKANATGTSDAYRPPGHTLAGGSRERGRSEYEAWTPPA